MMGVVCLRCVGAFNIRAGTYCFAVCAPFAYLYLLASLLVCVCVYIIRDIPSRETRTRTLTHTVAPFVCTYIPSDIAIKRISSGLWTRERAARHAAAAATVLCVCVCVVRGSFGWRRRRRRLANGLPRQCGMPGRCVGTCAPHKHTHFRIRQHTEHKHKHNTHASRSQNPVLYVHNIWFS